MRVVYLHHILEQKCLISPTTFQFSDLTLTKYRKFRGVFRNQSNIYDGTLCESNQRRKAEVILGFESIARQRYKRELFRYKKSIKGTSDLNDPYVHSKFSLVLINLQRKRIEGSVRKLDAVLA